MKVYFNNSCKICRSEINMYKKENIEDIDWIDITDNKDAEKETSKNDKELLRRLHIKENDQVIEGAEAFLYVWKKIPKYKQSLLNVLCIYSLFVWENFQNFRYYFISNNVSILKF